VPARVNCPDNHGAYLRPRFYKLSHQKARVLFSLSLGLSLIHSLFHFRIA
jgi:hypothetical protein